MKALVLAFAMIGTTAVSAMAADGCGPDRHFSRYFGHCVWNRYIEAPGYYDYDPGIDFNFGGFGGGFGGFGHHHHH